MATDDDIMSYPELIEDIKTFVVASFWMVPQVWSMPEYAHAKNSFRATDCGLRQ